RHPYTQLLIQSIPQADPKHPWQKEKLRTDASAPVASAVRGCKFADRCPHVMDICRNTVPPLFRTDERRAVACFLYQDKPKLEGAELDEVMSVPVTAVGA